MKFHWFTNHTPSKKNIVISSFTTLTLVGIHRGLLNYLDVLLVATDDCMFSSS